MAFLLMFVMLLHLVTLAMVFIATMEKSWWTWDSVDRADLWHKCIYDNATHTMMCTTVSENATFEKFFHHRLFSFKAE
ncbi:hypothetical protein QTP70_007473 [Hemibagrus guttatus]|uniref:Secreted protein n=1 Tax=Hemibagrus guttatus TaxID=175788 RepID=A0AAE0UNM9_9TELE|nr:hypothetical protein QTP70_007473 [Hemibagrus guttatus]